MRSKKPMDAIRTVLPNGITKYVQQMMREKRNYSPTNVSWSPKIVWISQVSCVLLSEYWQKINNWQFSTEYVKTGPAEGGSCP